MAKTADLLPGTLDMLILKAVSLKPLHGYGVLLRIRQISAEALEIPQGSLYPALYRLEHQELIAAEWGVSDNNRRAKFYTLTPAGRRRLLEETAGWNRLASAIA
ncbi:MAG: PadR family transcriptional regulator, partial [Acidobacteriota bacterium]